MVENTYRRKIVEYVKRNLRKGYPIATLRVALINQGYLRNSIDDAIKIAVTELAKEAPVIKEKPQIDHEIITDEIEPVKVKKKSFFRRSIVRKLFFFTSS